jgi:ribosome recycling factor
VIEDVLHDTTDKMNRSLEAFRKDLAKVRTGRASFALLEGVKVDYYGNSTPLQQVGTLSVPESRLITVAPWDAKMIGPIEKAIQQAGLGLNPSNDGKVVRIPIPPLTEERRKELVKVVHKDAEAARVSIRNVRRDAVEKLKEMEKKKEISEDDLKKAQEKIQKETDAWVKKVDETLKQKEQEILEV